MLNHAVTRVTAASSSRLWRSALSMTLPWARSCQRIEPVEIGLRTALGLEGCDQRCQHFARRARPVTNFVQRGGQIGGVPPAFHFSPSGGRPPPPPKGRTNGADHPPPQPPGPPPPPRATLLRPCDQTNI